MTARKVLTALGVVALLTAFLLPDGLASAGIILLCALASILLLWKNLPALSDLPEEHPKLGVIRQVTVMTVALVVGMVAVAVAAETGRLTLTPGQAKWLLTILFAALILVFGNLVPKLPWNRYTGLRLPWTVQDEQTWLVAHRMLGWMSLPFGSLTLAAGAIPNHELALKAVIGLMLGWIAIPSVLSLLFYLKKFGKR